MPPKEDYISLVLESLNMLATGEYANAYYVILQTT